MWQLHKLWIRGGKWRAGIINEMRGVFNVWDGES